MLYFNLVIGVNCGIFSLIAFFKTFRIIIAVYLPAPPQTGKPLVLAQKAVRLTVVDVTTILVMVDVPIANRNRLGPLLLGIEKPASISKGTTEDSSTVVLPNSVTGSLALGYLNITLLLCKRQYKKQNDTDFSDGRNALPS